MFFNFRNCSHQLKNNYQSKFVKNEEFEMMKQWLPKGTSWNSKLIFQFREHGKEGNAFHKQCHGKGNTITLIKAKFSGSTKTVTFGGFWTPNGIQ